MPPAKAKSARLLQELAAHHPKRVDLRLERIERLLAALGNPQHACPPIIHIAGTNGKGSTLAMLRAMLEAAGKRVHSYSSPHLIRFHERINLAGREIDEELLTRCLIECRTANDGQPITFFESTTAAAFLAMRQVDADYTLLETGLGGRLDATNLATPIMSIITPISHDHQEFLGETLAAIATEKAGILKPASAAISAPQPPEARNVLVARAEKLGVKLALGGRDWQVRGENGRLVFEDTRGLADLPLPALEGAHQSINAGTAIAAARQLGIGSAIARGLENAKWPARLQRLMRGALTEKLYASGYSDIWLDGGHNQAAAAALAAWLKAAWRETQLVVGMMARKDADGFFAAFADIGAPLRVATVPIAGAENCQPAATLALAAQKTGLSATAFDSLDSCLTQLADEQKTTAPRILFCGSLHLAGEILRRNG